jgi:drug/metabolite transporter (DMT)-like permease
VTTKALPAPATGLAIGLMLLGMFMFTLNDAIGKWLVATYSVGQVLLIRSVVALVVLAPFLRGGWRMLTGIERPRLQAARVAFSTAEVFCFYFAVTSLPLADVMTFWLAAPIYVAAVSPWLLGERVGPLRWTAIVVGFVGVVVALEPFGNLAQMGPQERLAVAVAFLGTGCFALMVVTGRQLRGTPDGALVFWQITGALVAGMVLAPFGWVTPTAPDFAMLGMLGVVAMAAHVCVNRALKLADAAVVAPFQYTLLPWAILMGWLFFGDVPRPAMILGGAIIIGAGLFIFLREQALARARRTS